MGYGPSLFLTLAHVADIFCFACLKPVRFWMDKAIGTTGQCENFACLWLHGFKFMDGQPLTTSN
jgi:hypothetical protein